MLLSSLRNLPMFTKVDSKENIVKIINGALLDQANFGLRS